MIAIPAPIGLAALAIAAGLTAAPCQASVTGDNAQWINNLKCSDLLKAGKHEANPENFPKFSLWFTGFAMGVSVVPPAGDLGDYATSMKVALAMVLTLCDLKPDRPAVDAAVSIMSFQYNMLHSVGPVDLLDPLRPAE